MGRSVFVRALGGVARVLIETVFPLACCACGARLGDAPAGDATARSEADALPLCASCRAGLVDCGPAFCLTCAQRVASPRACRRRDHQALRAGYAWNDELRAVVHRFKFGDVPELAPGLVAAVWASPAFAPRPRPDVIVPVPLHGLRRRERGYDQAAALARAFGEQAGAPVVDGLRRVRSTRQQARLGAVERRSNLAGAFAPRTPTLVRGRSVALVDDVVTTGATVDAAAAALTAGGARSIETWCVAYEPLE